MLNTEVSMFTFRTDVILCGLPRRQANVARAFIDHARACGDERSVVTARLSTLTSGSR
jgi:hypothetical protein